MKKHRLELYLTSYELYLSCRGNVNHYKSVHQPIPTRENREHPGNFQNKSVSSAFNWVLPFYFLKWNCYFSACKRKFLESTSQFYFKFCINLPCHQTYLLYTFFSSNIIYFGQKQLIKVQIFEILECLGQNFQISHVNFELTNQFLFKFCIILHCHDTKFPSKF